MILWRLDKKSLLGSCLLVSCLLANSNPLQSIIRTNGVKNGTVQVQKRNAISDIHSILADWVKGTNHVKESFHSQHLNAIPVQLKTLGIQSP